jgi:hypothetical protein
MITKAASSNRELDEIVDLIGESLQLTPSQFHDAEEKYQSIGKNLCNSSLSEYDPDVYCQDSG